MATRLVLWLLAILAILVPAGVAGQECGINCLIVEGPRISRTAFTNWEKIELAYTVRWMDGYEPVFNDLKPQAMSFGILELDPDLAEEVDIRNEREFENENFFDIVYHLRYMGEKKGELTIPGQKFPYRKIQSSDDNIQYFSTQEFKLVYNTVLTKDADDIKEEIDLGSYQNVEMYWKISAALVAIIGILGSFILIFFRPVPPVLITNATGIGDSRVADKTVDLPKVFSELEANIAERNLGAVCNGLTDLIRVYVPGVKKGLTSKDVVPFITLIPHKWERDRLLRVHQTLCDIEDHLFTAGGDTNGKIDNRMSNLVLIIRELRPWSMYWRRSLFRLSQKAKRPFIFISKIRSWRSK